MYQDVVELRAFYQSLLGKLTTRLLRRKLRAFWPDVTGLDILGLGYGTPYLEQMRQKAERTIALMPAQQGIMHWPNHDVRREKDKQNMPSQGNLTALAHETQLPLKDASMDRILIVHMLEHTEDPQHMLREVWRILAPGGRLIVIVPNRMGFWARSDHTPFGHGKPFTSKQVRQILNDNMFTPLRTEKALAFAPFRNRTMLSMAPAIERVGQRWWQNLSGVLMFEAEKQIYALRPRSLKRKRVIKPVILGNNKTIKD